MLYNMNGYFLLYFELLNSLVCYELQTLCLMNNGLGING